MDASVDSPTRSTDPLDGVQGAQNGQDRPEIDLDRLVWDPEYRHAMRSHLKNDL
jgi:hypothetical protein